MPNKSAVILGLPGSGKTTFLAALWHLISSREIPTVLSFKKLEAGNAAHLNRIASRWRAGKEQDRTELSGNHVVTMNLLEAGGTQISVSFPDVAGESYRQMWEDRICRTDILEYLKSPGVILFIHADKIRPPQWVVDEVELSRKLGLPVPASGAEVPWHPRLAPTQVPLVDLLQMLQSPPLVIGSRRLAIVFSAWDKVRSEGLTPTEFLRVRLPLLNQYLKSESALWESRTYGVSAQGGDYERVDKEGTEAVINPETEKLREIDKPSERIRLWRDNDLGHDITSLVDWVIQ